MPTLDSADVIQVLFRHDHNLVQTLEFQRLLLIPTPTGRYIVQFTLNCPRTHSRCRLSRHFSSRFAEISVLRSAITLKENSLDHSSTSQLPILIAFVPWGCSLFQGCTPPLRLQSETPLPPSPRPASRHTRRSWSWDRRERHD